MGRVCSSCGEGVVRASAVSELTERVTFFFFSITNLELSIISIKLKRFFVIDRAAKEILCRTPVSSFYVQYVISVSVAPLAGRRRGRRLEQRRPAKQRRAE